MTTTKDSINGANPNTLPDLMRSARLGDVLRAQTVQVRRKQNPDTAGVSPYDLATLDVIQLPDDGKATDILRAYARAGTAAAGGLTRVAPNVTPMTTEIAVTPAGNIALLAADAYTDVDIEYYGARGESFSIDVSAVVANVLTIPATLATRGVVLLMEAEALTGTATGKKIVLAPGAGAPAAGQARLNLAKSTVTFAAADAVATARVKLLLVETSGRDLDSVLRSDATIL